MSLPFLSRVRNWSELAVQVHFQASLLAKHWHVSQRTLERQFRRQLSPSPQKYLDQIRQVQAEKFACDGMRTKEIAIALEYKQSSHFCRQFSNHHHGINPRAWRDVSVAQKSTGRHAMLAKVNAKQITRPVGFPR